MLSNRTCVIVDAGHGGIDGGATSCTGILESNLNLEIAVRLNDLLRFLGYNTKMIRTSNVSIYTEGTTIAAQKVSDLKNRVNIVNETPNSILVSIHQNYFAQSKYSGAQVFYSNNGADKQLAQAMQSAFRNTINLGNKREAKHAKGIYLMENIRSQGILIECGFISNPQEEALIRSEAYQKKISAVIATTLSVFLDCS